MAVLKARSPNPVRLLFALLFAPVLVAQPAPVTWTPDNGNGTFTNPLFYDEFSDPDMIRVGEDYYLTGTTMHSMPGLPILHSKDLVNWRFLTYAMDRLDLGPAFRLENAANIYGQGIWAPSFRYHAGTFYIFSNVNGHTTQKFTASDPAGPWQHTAMRRSFHDLSVLFDDDGKRYVIWGYRGIRMAQLNDDLTDIVPGTEREIIAADAGMGEGLHFYKIGKQYFITSAWFDGRMRMPAARAERPEGPYEVNPAISIDEDFGLAEGHRLSGKTPPYQISPANPEPRGRMSLHQGGVIQTPLGEWWGYSMMDFNSVGRLTALSPITWQEGWPYFGLPGNLRRTPRTWIKPKTTSAQPVGTPFTRNDDFSGPALNPLWQWNHIPVNEAWSLGERNGYLRLHALPATTLWDARNTLTQRSIGPRSTPTIVLDTSGMAAGDIAGLALFNRPYAWIAVERTAEGTSIAQFDEQTGRKARVRIDGSRVWLRADCDFLTEQARFSYSMDGVEFTRLGDEHTMVFQLTTFQGVRYALFSYSTTGTRGGFADFDSIDVLQPYPRGLMKPIPYGKHVLLTSLGKSTGLSVTRNGPGSGQPEPFEVVDMGHGRAAFKAARSFLSIADDGRAILRAGRPGDAESFQWIETFTGELVLLSVKSHRFLRIAPLSGAVDAESSGPQSDGKDGVRFVWSLTAPDRKR